MNVTEMMRVWLRKKSVIGAVLVVVLVVVFVSLNLDDDESATAKDDKKAIVATTSANNYSDGQSLSLIGSVRAFSEAKVTSERAGRVVSVNVELGQQIRAGMLIASLENASERASVLQAEGSYDAAVAASAQNSVGVGEAETAVRVTQESTISTLKRAYNSTNGVVVNTVDTFFSQPNSSVPGLRINGRGYTQELNESRVNFQTLLPAWKANVESLSTNSDLRAELDYSRQNVQLVINMVDIFIPLFNRQDGSNKYTESELRVFSDSFTNLRSGLISTLQDINSARSNLDSVADTLERAKLSASGSQSSASDAQIKQALGSLRAAQANLAKTVLRTPISGTVNSISIRQGDFINSFAQVAIVANNSALEIVTYVSDDELKLINEGDEVIVENEFTGTITQIAPAVDADTRKTEVRIAVDGTNISNGDTVKITKDVSVDESVDLTIQVPLTAVKFARENGSMFFVEDDVVVSRSVTLGKVVGNSVEIIEGLQFDEEFVTDVRGLVNGEAVQIQN